MIVQGLLLAGAVHQCVKGADWLLGGAERITGVPLQTGAHAMAALAMRDAEGLVLAGADTIGLAGPRDMLSRLRHPMHLFHRKKMRVGQGDDDGTPDDTTTHQKKSLLARLLADLETVLGKARSKHAKGKAAIATRIGTAQLGPQTDQEAQAAASGVFSQLAQCVGTAAHGASQQNLDAALRLATQAVALGELAHSPPTDARGVLRSDDSDEMRGLKTDVINAAYQPNPPIGQLAQRLIASQPGLEDYAGLVVDPLSGQLVDPDTGMAVAGRDVVKTKVGKRQAKTSALDWEISGPLDFMQSGGDQGGLPGFTAPGSQAEQRASAAMGNAFSSMLAQARQQKANQAARAAATFSKLVPGYTPPAGQPTTRQPVPLIPTTPSAFGALKSHFVATQGLISRDPNTDASGNPIDPDTGYQLDPQTGYPIDPATGNLIDPQTGWFVDPSTGYETNPETGDMVDPSTGFPIDPSSGQPYDPQSGLAMDPGYPDHSGDFDQSYGFDPNDPMGGDGMPVAGHDHKHGHACTKEKCDGKCDACTAAKKPKKGAIVVAGVDHGEAHASMTWDGPASYDIDDDEGQAIQAALKTAAPCPTGTCAVRRG